MKPLAHRVIGDFYYEVIVDEDFMLNEYLGDMEPSPGKKVKFGFDCGDLCAYGIMKFKYCKCCNQPNRAEVIDSIWGIVENSPLAALEEGICQIS